MIDELDRKIKDLRQVNPTAALMVEQWRAELGPTIPTAKITKETRGQFNGRSMQNLQSRGELPKGVLINDSARRSLVCRDSLLLWWCGKLLAAVSRREVA